MTWQAVTESIAPVRMFWRVEAPTGSAEIRLDVDLMSPIVPQVQLEQLLIRWWFNVWAPLLHNRVRCITQGVFPYTFGGPSGQFIPEEQKGFLGGTVSSPQDSVLVIAWTGDNEASGNRRLYVPFIPTSLHDGHVLSDAGFSKLLTAMRGVFLGCDARRGGTGPRLIVWRPARPSDRFNVERPAQWAHVEQLIVCSFLDRVPVLA